jgi:signal transduction histidine kinase/ActR/RegA family two-component response regulator
MPTPELTLVKQKLTWVSSTYCGIAILFVCSVFAYIEMAASEATEVEHLSRIGQMVAAQHRGALSLKASPLKGALSDALAAVPEIASAAIYSDDGSVLTSYLRDQREASVVVPPPVDGLEKGARSLSLTEPILLQGKRLGTIYIRSDLAPAQDRLSKFLPIIVAVLTAFFGIYLLFSRLLQKLFDPLLQLTQTMTGVSDDGDYSVRVPTRSDDELSELAGGFNKMLAQIQKSDAASEVARIEMENCMRERTSKLQEEIAERTRLEQQLLQAQKMEALGQLAGGIAHDFNNLLTVIMGNLSLARLQSGQDGKVAALLQAAEQGTHRASDLTRQLLAVGRRTFNIPKAFDLHEVVVEVVQILKRTIDPRIVILTPAAEVVWLVHADSGQMFQALMNLCVNARDAMPNGGRLQIALQNVTRKMHGKENPALDPAPGCFVRLIVSDTGMGMEPETCRRIFEPFFTTKEVGKGMGLGLAMVYGIVTQNKGTITVESKPNEGSRFTIELSRHMESAGAQAHPVSLTPEPCVPKSAQGSGETVLVVEDEDQIRKLARQVLEQLGYAVLEAEDGVQGLIVYQAEKKRIAAVILDLTMPKKSGLEVLATLRRLNPTVRVILSSGYSAAAQKLDLAKLGVMAFLQKPYVPNDLARTLRNVLDQTP